MEKTVTVYSFLIFSFNNNKTEESIIETISAPIFCNIFPFCNQLALSYLLIS